MKKMEFAKTAELDRSPLRPSLSRATPGSLPFKTINFRLSAKTCKEIIVPIAMLLDFIYLQTALSSPLKLPIELAGKFVGYYFNFRH